MTIRRLARVVATGIAAAAAAGLLSATVTRALMHVVALLVGEPTHFSVGGSAGIALIYTVALTPGCIALAFSQRRWPWVLLGAGAALLLFEAGAIGVEETSAATGMTPARVAGLVLVLVAMVAAYGLQVRLAARWSRSQLRAVPGVDGRGGA